MCSPVCCFGTHLAQTSWNEIIPWAEPWLLHHFISSCPFIIQNQGMDSFSVSFHSECGHMSWSFFNSDTCVALSEHDYPFTHFPLQWSTISLLCWKSVINFCHWYIFSPQKWYHCTLLFFGAYGKWSGHDNSAMITLQLACQGWKYFKIMQGVWK